MIFYINPAIVTNFIRFRKKELIHDLNGEKISARKYQGNRYAGLIVKDKAIKTGKSLQRCPHIRGTYQRFSEGRDWIDTEYKILFETWYKKVLDEKYKLSTFEDFFNHRLIEWDKIYMDIKTNGFKQDPLIHGNVEVAINADGQFLLIDGRHRLSFAQILGLAKIPVVANVISESFAGSFIRHSSALEEQLTTDHLGKRLNSISSKNIQ